MASDGNNDLSRRELLAGAAAVGTAAALGGLGSSAQAASLDRDLAHHVKTVVVIYGENRSFNNLFAGFPGLANPLHEADASRFAQTDRDGKTVLAKLPKIWDGLLSQPQTIAGKSYNIAADAFNLENGPFILKDISGESLDPALVTRDLWHRFYQNQMQINGGKNDQFVAWADSGALVMGRYDHQDMSKLNLWKAAQEFTLCDNFFMAGFGGSFFNHFMLIAAEPPFYPDAAHSPAKGKISVLEDDSTPLGTRLKIAATSPASAMDGVPKFVNDGTLTPDFYAVNTMAPPYQPSYVKSAEGGDPHLADAHSPAVLPPQTFTTIGDLLTARNISWAWYGGAWQATLDGQATAPVPNFQYHHQPFNYFANLAPGTAARKEHLRDGGLGNDPATNKFLADIDAGRLPAVTFYKPQGNLNLHAGYADIASGDEHFGVVLEHLRKSPQWKNMVVVFTVDENGGWWDHVAPPKADRWGPGSRIPAIVMSPFARKGVVDHGFYDTTSILRFITRLHRLPLLRGIKIRDEALAQNGQPPLGDLTETLHFG